MFWFCRKWFGKLQFVIHCDLGLFKDFFFQNITKIVGNKYVFFSVHCSSGFLFALTSWAGLLLSDHLTMISLLCRWIVSCLHQLDTVSLGVFCANFFRSHFLKIFVIYYVYFKIGNKYVFFSVHCSSGFLFALTSWAGLLLSDHLTMISLLCRWIVSCLHQLDTVSLGVFCANFFRSHFLKIFVIYYVYFKINDLG